MKVIDPVCNMTIEDQNAFTAECEGKTFYFCSKGCKDKFLQERKCNIPKTSYDLIIIGGGPAGLTAAVYAATLKIDAFLIANDLGGQAIDSTKIENYMGYDFITGPELTEKFQYQLIHSNYIDHLMGDVEEIKSNGAGFNITTSGLRAYSAKTLIIATGMTRRKLKVKGEEEFQRKGVFYGNIQDFSFVQGENAAVIGGGNSALQFIENLKDIAKNIFLISDSGLVADPVIIERIGRFKNLKIYEEYKVLEFKGEKTLSSVKFRKIASEEILEVPVKGVFIAIGLHPNSALVSDLIETNNQGEIIINPDCSTSCPGMFAAGDVTNAFGKRIIIASGEGAKAALATRQYLLDFKKQWREK